MGSRNSPQLLRNLLADDSPILFEGLHTCFHLADQRLQHRRKLVRMHNIESNYYQQLAQNEKSWLRKCYFALKSWQLARFESILQHADGILSISPADDDYLRRIYGKKVHYLPAFHAHKEVESLVGRNNYALYHGNLSVNENIRAALFLIREVFNDLPVRLLIAGKNPSIELFEAVQAHPHIEILPNPSALELFAHMENAHLHVLPTFQPTGFKLKLIHALFSGRFCLVNEAMVHQNNLRELCEVANTPQEWKQKVRELMEMEFSESHLLARKSWLESHFDNRRHAEALLGWMSAEVD